jgi:hypothetical protein
MSKILLFLIFSLSGFVSISGTIDPFVDDSKYIEYGTKFNNVLSLEGKNTKDQVMLGSCVLIDKEWVLTAAHISIEMSSGGVKYNDEIIPIDKLIIHKDFNIDRFGIADISLCHLSREIHLDSYPELYDDNNELGKICSISGFGFTGTFETTSKFSDGKRRAGHNFIEAIQEDLLVCSPSKDDKKTNLEFLIAHGDSGGGLFIESKLAGINSCVMATDKKTDSSYTDEGGHTRVSKYKPWIIETIKNYEK